ncbi:Deoxyribodipyrimidine photo-lyase [Sulfitobacter noctilucae]|uniref:FAD-binding domain-containing protein n=1 Tax=Sulfitobacter noctilucae TaxID=1342302 RepID=UPI00046AB2E2|nr:FAD-binding domain-containing protein [Sulfitobacter noctilucae]KIN60700.1 Deoxyribodipyrimidine photo-lyase [Sulfitobacter noctilucae]
MTQETAHDDLIAAPGLTDARARLAGFAPHAGSAYAEGRNFDHGPGRHDAVSTLSPYLKLRALDEIDVTRAVLAHHSAEAADKYLTEVFWRTYWKGWMEMRPGVWEQYLSDLNQLRDDVQTQSGLRARWEDACSGQTGIAPFDAWAQELVQTGYLHNHARMWFASIWIFTLELPWQLGADFFLRHLLDGDAAVNTLSWRWVAGIQTRGKSYLADPGNIARFTGGRFVGVRGLVSTAHPQEAPPNPDPMALPPCDTVPLASRYGLLLHDDDVNAERMRAAAPDAVAVAYADASEGHSPWHIAPHVAAFRQATAQSTLPEGQQMDTLATAQAIADWARENALEQIVAGYAPVGPVQQMFAAYRAIDGVPPINLMRRPLDSTAWPLATKGFFPFRKHIPDLIARFARD